MLNLIREKRNTLSIKINEQGEMIIKAPKKMPLSEILSFVNKHESWINKKQEMVKNANKVNEAFINYSKYLFLGNGYNAVFSNNLAEPVFDDKSIILPNKYSKNAPYYMAKWLKIKALEIIESRLLYLANTFNFSFNSLKLINSKVRWGTCNKESVLAFNWRMIMLPPKTIDYIIIHELAHTIEFNHSKKFWEIVQMAMPDFKEQRDIVKNCNFILALFR